MPVDNHAADKPRRPSWLKFFLFKVYDIIQS
jgi:hypothetical protein